MRPHRLALLLLPRGTNTAERGPAIVAR